MTAQDTALAAPAATDWDSWSVHGGKQQLPKVGFRVPDAAGFVAGGYRAPGVDTKTVIVIEDAHANPSAQLNAARIIGEIAAADAAHTIYTEGAQGDVTLSSLSGGAEVDLARAQALVHKARLSGFELADLTAPGRLRLWGVEDEPLYDEALELYRQTAAGRAAALTFLDRAERAMDALSEDMFTAQLRELLAARTAHESGDLSTVRYFEQILTAGTERGMTLSGYKNLGLLRRLAKGEAEIDEAQLVAEQAEAIEALPSEDQRELGQPDSGLSPAAMLAYWQSARERGAMIRKDSHLGRYLQHLRRCRKLDAAGAINELSRLEQSIFGALAPSEDARTLLEIIRRYETLRRMLTLQASPENFAAYQTNRPAYDSARLTAFLNARIHALGRYYDKAVFLDEEYDQAEKAASAFYEISARRDSAMVNNLVERMNAVDEKQAVLVAGGFHAPGLEREFRARGISYLLIIPAATHPTDTALYEKLLLAQKRSSQIPSPPIVEAPAARAGSESSKGLLMLRPLAASARLADPAARMSLADLGLTSSEIPAAEAHGARMADDMGEAISKTQQLMGQGIRKISKAAEDVSGKVMRAEGFSNLEEAFLRHQTTAEERHQVLEHLLSHLRPTMTHDTTETVAAVQNKELAELVLHHVFHRMPHQLRVQEFTDIAKIIGRRMMGQTGFRKEFQDNIFRQLVFAMLTEPEFVSEVQEQANLESTSDEHTLAMELMQSYQELPQELVQVFRNSNPWTVVSNVQLWIDEHDDDLADTDKDLLRWASEVMSHESAARMAKPGMSDAERGRVIAALADITARAVAPRGVEGDQVYAELGKSNPLRRPVDDVLQMADDTDLDSDYWSDEIRRELSDETLDEIDARFRLLGLNLSEGGSLPQNDLYQNLLSSIRQATNLEFSLAGISGSFINRPDLVRRIITAVRQAPTQLSLVLIIAASEPESSGAVHPLEGLELPERVRREFSDDERLVRLMYEQNVSMMTALTTDGSSEDLTAMSAEEAWTAFEKSFMSWIVWYIAVDAFDTIKAPRSDFHKPEWVKWRGQYTTQNADRIIDINSRLKEYFVKNYEGIRQKTLTYARLMRSIDQWELSGRRAQNRMPADMAALEEDGIDLDVFTDVDRAIKEEIGPLMTDPPAGLLDFQTTQFKYEQAVENVYQLITKWLSFTQNQVTAMEVMDLMISHVAWTREHPRKWFYLHAGMQNRLPPLVTELVVIGAVNPSIDEQTRQLYFKRLDRLMREICGVGIRRVGGQIVFNYRALTGQQEMTVQIPQEAVERERFRSEVGEKVSALIWSGISDRLILLASAARMAEDSNENWLRSKESITLSVGERLIKLVPSDSEYDETAKIYRVDSTDGNEDIKDFVFELDEFNGMSPTLLEMTGGLSLPGLYESAIRLILKAHNNRLHIVKITDGTAAALKKISEEGEEIEVVYTDNYFIASGKYESDSIHEPDSSNREVIHVEVRPRGESRYAKVKHDKKIIQIEVTSPELHQLLTIVELGKRAYSWGYLDALQKEALSIEDLDADDEYESDEDIVEAGISFLLFGESKTFVEGYLVGIETSVKIIAKDLINKYIVRASEPAPDIAEYIVLKLIRMRQILMDKLNESKQAGIEPLPADQNIENAIEFYDELIQYALDGVLSNTLHSKYTEANVMRNLERDGVYAASDLANILRLTYAGNYHGSGGSINVELPDDFSSGHGADSSPRETSIHDMLTGYLGAFHSNSPKLGLTLIREALNKPESYDPRTVFKFETIPDDEDSEDLEDLDLQRYIMLRLLDETVTKYEPDNLLLFSRSPKELLAGISFEGHRAPADIPSPREIVEKLEAYLKNPKPHVKKIKESGLWGYLGLMPTDYQGGQLPSSLKEFEKFFAGLSKISLKSPGLNIVMSDPGQKVSNGLLADGDQLPKTETTAAFVRGWDDTRGGSANKVLIFTDPSPLMPDPELVITPSMIAEWAAHQISNNGTNSSEPTITVIIPRNYPGLIEAIDKHNLGINKNNHIKIPLAIVVIMPAEDEDGGGDESDQSESPRPVGEAKIPNAKLVHAARLANQQAYEAIDRLAKADESLLSFIAAKILIAKPAPTRPGQAERLAIGLNRGFAVVGVEREGITIRLLVGEDVLAEWSNLEALRAAAADYNLPAGVAQGVAESLVSYDGALIEAVAQAQTQREAAGLKRPFNTWTQLRTAELLSSDKRTRDAEILLLVSTLSWLNSQKPFASDRYYLSPEGLTAAEQKMIQDLIPMNDVQRIMLGMIKEADLVSQPDAVPSQWYTNPERQIKGWVNILMPNPSEGLIPVGRAKQAAFMAVLGAAKPANNDEGVRAAYQRAQNYDQAIYEQVVGIYGAGAQFASAQHFLSAVKGEVTLMNRLPFHQIRSGARLEKLRKMRQQIETMA